MATERFILGKHDSAHHEGKRSEVKRIAEAEEQVRDFLRGGQIDLHNAPDQNAGKLPLADVKKL